MPAEQAANSALARRMSIIEASSAMRSPGVRGSVSFRVNPNSGIYPSNRWTVEAGSPVASDSLLAALPVGLHRYTGLVWCSAL